MRIQEKIGAGVLSLGLVIGLSGFAGATTGTIDTTGPGSDNRIESDTSYRVDVDNDNNLKVYNDNDQKAWTGDAEVEMNTTGGDAETGAAWNDNAFDAEVVVDNSASVAGALGGVGGGGTTEHEATIENTGPYSDNKVEFESRTNIDIDNNNDLYVHNDNNQYASSGDAEVKYNTTGGNATTGDATNSNSTSVRFEVTN